MKAALLCAVILLTFASARAQLVPPPVIEETQLEQFSSRPGTVIQRELTRLGDVAGLQVDLVNATDLMAKNSVLGVRFSRSAPTGSRDENTALLDADEIGPLVRAIDVIKTTAFSTTPDNFTDLVYRTRGGFAIGALYANRRWIGFMRLDRFDPRTAIYAGPSEIDSLRALLVKAREGTR